MIPFPWRISSRRATEILHYIFGHVTTGCAFRLWDGTSVVLGQGAPVCTAVVHHPETFIRLIRDPTPLNFAEAYVEGAIDLEGDLFHALDRFAHRAHQIVMEGPSLRAARAPSPTRGPRRPAKGAAEGG